MSTVFASHWLMGSTVDMSLLLNQLWYTPYWYPTLLLAVMTFVLYRYIALPLYLSPLSSIPNAHPLAALTPLWMDWRRYTSREYETVHEAFEKHGPVVRLGPNEIAINTRNAINRVYGSGLENFDKATWYEFFINHGKRNTFTSLGADHAARRKVVNGIYGKSYLQRSRHVQAIIAELINGRLLPVVREAIVSGSPIDILETSIAYGVDFLTAFEFGLPRSTDFLRKASSRKSWLDLHRRAHPLEYMFWFLEHWHLTKLLVKVGLNVVPKAYFQADADYDAWGTEFVEKTECALQEGSSEEATPSGDWPIEYYQLRKAMAQELDVSEGSFFTPTEKQKLELASECLDHINATRDIIPTVLPLVFYYLSKHSDAQIRLRAELQSLQKPLWYRQDNPTCVSNAALPEPATLENLPYLGAVLKESIRLRNGQPVLNPRVTPSGRRTTLGPYRDIPSGVRIVACGYCLHRNEEIFPECKRWMPERWLDSTKEELSAMNELFWGFGSGSRQCLGRNVAMELLRFAIAAIYTNFETVVVDDAMFNDKMLITGSLKENLLLSVKHAA